MLKNFQNHALVTLIAILIWVLAEAESIRVVERQVDVRIKSHPDASRVFQVDPAQEFNGTVTLRLEGSTASIDAIANDLRRPIDLTQDLLNLPAGAAKSRVDLRAALRAHPLFKERGVTPTEATPQYVTLDVDDLATCEVRVTVSPPEGALLQGVPEPTPAAVTLQLPSRLAAMLPGDAAVTADLDPAAVSQLPPGRAQTLNAVRLELPREIRSDPMATFARPDPPTVSVNLTIQSGTERFRLPPVPVTLRIAPIDYAQWDVQIDAEDQTVNDASVTGPRDLIAQIEARKVQVFAVVPLDWQQLEAAAQSGQPVSRDAVFMLSAESPAPVQFDAPDRSVRLTVRRRPAGPGPAGAPGG